MPDTDPPTPLSDPNDPLEARVHNAISAVTTRHFVLLDERMAMTYAVMNIIRPELDLSHQAEAALARVREIHRPHELPFISGRKKICRGCAELHPCATLRAIYPEETPPYE